MERQILIITGSHRSKQISYSLAKLFENNLKKEFRTKAEICELANVEIRGCCALAQCSQTEEKRCVYEDSFNVLYDKMVKSDGIIFVLPKYAPYPSKFMAMIERLVAISYWGFNAEGLLEQFDLFKKPAVVLAFAASPQISAERFYSLFDSIAAIGFDLVRDNNVPGIYLNRSLGNDEEEIRKLVKALMEKVLCRKHISRS